MIPQNSPLSNYLSHKSAIDAAIRRVLRSGQYILGKETAAFEKEFADYIGVKYAVSTGSGTEALHLALRALGVGPGDEVITVSHTAVATVAAIEMCGALPVLVDISPASYTADPDLVSHAITPRTKAIVPVHLYGQPADLSPLLTLAKHHHVGLLEDCAQAHGAEYRSQKVGSFGDMGAFSFYPTKNLGCLGDGGAITTNHEQFYHKLVALRQYGWDQDRVSRMPGFNSRLDELQAGVLRAKLGHLDDDNRKRTWISRTYEQWIGNTSLTLPVPLPETVHVYHQYVVRCPDRSVRDRLRGFLRKREIQTAIHYPVPVHLQPAYLNRFEKGRSLPVTENVCHSILSLPMFPELTREELDTISTTIHQALKDAQSV